MGRGELRQGTEAYSGEKRAFPAMAGGLAAASPREVSTEVELIM